MLREAHGAGSQRGNARTVSLEGRFGQRLQGAVCTRAMDARVTVHAPYDTSRARTVFRIAHAMRWLSCRAFVDVCITDLAQRDLEHSARFIDAGMERQRMRGQCWAGGMKRWCTPRTLCDRPHHHVARVTFQCVLPQLQRKILRKERVAKPAKRRPQRLAGGTVVLFAPVSFMAIFTGAYGVQLPLGESPSISLLWYGRCEWIGRNDASRSGHAFHYAAVACNDVMLQKKWCGHLCLPETHANQLAAVLKGRDVEERGTFQTICLAAA